MNQPCILAMRITWSWKMASLASVMGGTVKLLFELSVDPHESATFLCDNGELLCHVAYTVAVGVAVQFRFAVGVVVVPI